MNNSHHATPAPSPPLNVMRKNPFEDLLEAGRLRALGRLSGSTRARTSRASGRSDFAEVGVDERMQVASREKIHTDKALARGDTDAKPGALDSITPGVDRTVFAQLRAIGELRGFNASDNKSLEAWFVAAPRPLSGELAKSIGFLVSDLEIELDDRAARRRVLAADRKLARTLAYRGDVDVDNEPGRFVHIMEP